MLDYSYEQKFAKRHKTIAGVDEVGVGPLAGPVVAAAVVFSPKVFASNTNTWWEEMNDSKKLSHKKREELLKVIVEKSESFSIGTASVEEIDKLNILQARLIAMKRAVENLKKFPSLVLVDGNRMIKNIKAQQKTIVKGDAKVLSIACASIVAKVTRDNLLKNLHEKFPEYGFDVHKGYPTKMHFEKLKQFGPCEIHRKSFAPVKELLFESEA